MRRAVYCRFSAAKGDEFEAFVAQLGNPERDPAEVITLDVSGNGLGAEHVQYLLDQVKTVPAVKTLLVGCTSRSIRMAVCVKVVEAVTDRCGRVSHRCA